MPYHPVPNQSSLTANTLKAKIWSFFDALDIIFLMVTFVKYRKDCTYINVLCHVK